MMTIAQAVYAALAIAVIWHAGLIRFLAWRATR